MMEVESCITHNEPITEQSTWPECPTTVRMTDSGSSSTNGDPVSGPDLDRWEQSSTGTSDDRSIEDRKQAIWEDMRMRMESRRRDWDIEVERLRKDFFQSKPISGTSSALRETVKDDNKTVERSKSTVSEEGSKFHVCFDLSFFHPNEICVRTEERKLVVYARHQEKSPDGKRTAIREFNRQVDIPKSVQPEAMRCTLTKEGFLHVEADMTRPGSPLGSITIHAQKTNPWAIESSPGNTKESAEAKTFTISVNIGKDFEPEDMTVKTVDRKLVVSARREELRPGSSSMKEFYREFDLPETVDPSTVTANMTPEGDLLIEAPL